MRVVCAILRYILLAAHLGQMFFVLGAGNSKSKKIKQDKKMHLIKQLLYCDCNSHIHIRISGCFNHRAQVLLQAEILIIENLFRYCI